MRRAAIAVVVAACGSPPRGNVVSVATVDASSPPAAIVKPEPRPSFEVILAGSTCLLMHDRVRCRQQMDVDNPFASEPIVAGLENVDVTSAAFGRDYGCVTTRAGEVRCWGGNHFGQLGANVRDDRHEAPVVLPNLHDAKRVYAGPFHACAILGDGKVSCWGKNQLGENGSATNYLEAARELVEPHVVPGPTDVTDLALGWKATCAITSKAHAWCWGNSKPPAEDASLAGASSITANEETFCAIQDEKVRCWGELMMLVPEGSRETTHVFDEIAHARRVKLGASHGCVVDALGAVWCFGVPHVAHEFRAAAPAKIEGLPRAVDVMCSTSYSCALTTTNEVWCWGQFTWNDEQTHKPTRIAIR